MRRLSPKGPERRASCNDNDYQAIHIELPLSTTTTQEVHGNEDDDQKFIDKTSNHKINLSILKSKFRSFTVSLTRQAESALSNLSPHHGGRDSMESNQDRLRRAATIGDWKTAEAIEAMENGGILSEVISEDRNETALHIATRLNKFDFVKNLLTKLTPQHLASRNSYGNTALSIAAYIGAVDIAKCMVEMDMDMDLVHMVGCRDATPISIAARYKHNHMLSYLLSLPTTSSNTHQMELLVDAIFANHYDIAFIILKENDSLALERDINEDTPLHIMARKPNVIASYKKTTKWQSYIDNRWLKGILKKTRMQIKAREMVGKMWETVKRSENTEEKLINFMKHPTSMLHDAARFGNVEFLEVVFNENPELLRIFDDDGKSIFHVALENRQESVFNLIYDMKLFKPDDLLFYFNEEKISLLELAAKIPHPSRLQRTSGAVFQMHSELLWFKEVKNIAELTTIRRLRKRGEQTAKELFSEEHKELKEEGEKWVKKTANSCMLVATLIATVVFAAAFTVPGGQHESIGSPIFLVKNWFTVFVISDGIALISSSTSILLFLSILTSRCAENDFLFWLPLELVCGLGFLFVSVMSMVLAFSAAFFLYYGKDTAPLPWFITWMAVVPIFWFCVLQWKLWTHALVSLHATTVSCWLWNKKTSMLKAIANGLVW